MQVNPICLEYRHFLVEYNLRRQVFLQKRGKILCKKEKTNIITDMGRNCGQVQGYDLLKYADI
ncbi:hypothetical protein D7V81_13285 [bacterium 1XD21-70]|nr:hypothetical protein D7V81_13285 [bacterium 1XD21-70]